MVCLHPKTSLHPPSESCIYKQQLRLAESWSQDNLIQPWIDWKLRQTLTVGLVVGVDSVRKFNHSVHISLL